MNKWLTMTDDERKWYQKPFWLISLGILALGSISNSANVGRFLILIFIITGILFLLWFFYSFIKTKNKFIAFIAFITSIIVTIAFLIVLFLLFNWIKCGDNKGDIFSGKCSRIKKTTTPTTTPKSSFPPTSPFYGKTLNDF